MWAFKFRQEQTRGLVPSYGNFMRSNHSLMKLWYEDLAEPIIDRMPFSLRCMRFLATTCILFIFTYVIIMPDDLFYQQECHKRLECYNACNKAYFPALGCKRLDRLHLLYNWNTYDSFFIYNRPDPAIQGEHALQDFDKCKSYILSNEYYPFTRAQPHRQIQVHSCFSYCANGDDFAFLGDDRPQCIDLPPEMRDQIVCLTPEAKCEVSSTADQIQITEWVVFSPLTAVLAIVASAPFIFFFDYLSILLQTTKVNMDSARESCRFMTFQVFMILVFVYIVSQSIFYTQITIRYGSKSLIFLTTFIGFTLDLIVQVPLLSLVYTIMVRRFGYLKVNEKEWLDYEAMEIKQEQAIPRLKKLIMQMLEHKAVETFSKIVIYVYAVFILFDLTFSDMLNTPTQIMTNIDSCFLAFFFVEICFKTFASSGMYLGDFFNCFDASIVVFSVILNIIGVVAKGLGVLRLIRVVVITIRQITGSQSKLRHASKQANPVDAVVKILQQLPEITELPKSVQKEAKWVIDVIESNKLYELNIDMSSEEKNMDMEAKAWLNISTEAANDTKSWFERDLDDFLKELHREAEEIDPAQLEEEEERLKQLVQLPSRTWTTLSKLLDTFDKWDFDLFAYKELLDEEALSHFGFKLFQAYGLLDKFSISDQNFANLMKEIKAATYEGNSYHNVARAIEVTRNFHYFTKHGELMQHFSDLNIMAAFLASLLLDISHPGVNNAFLVAMKHTKALRYNDRSVLENHHCAIGFKLLLDPQNDIFELLSEAQYWSVRQIITKMILSSDISNHFTLIMTFKSRLSSKNFPEDSIEDKQLLMNYVLYMSDHTNPCKPPLIYFKWLTVEMEEYYQQGDLERKLEYSVSPFFDRTTCNPFKYQLGYMDVVVMPIVDSWVQFKTVFEKDLLTNGLLENRKFLEQKVEETKTMLLEQKQQQKEQAKKDKLAEKERAAGGGAAGAADATKTGGALQLTSLKKTSD